MPSFFFIFLESLDGSLVLRFSLENKTAGICFTSFHPNTMLCYAAFALIAALLPVTSADGGGKAIVKNNCPRPIYLDSVGGSSNSEPKEIKPGSDYSESYRHSPGGGGVSIKISNTKEGVSAHPMQFEYTLVGQLYYDISNINGYPLEKGGVSLTPSQGKCPKVNCPPGEECKAAYNTPEQNTATHACSPSTDLILELCVNGDSSSGNSTSSGLPSGSTGTTGVLPTGTTGLRPTGTIGLRPTGTTGSVPTGPAGSLPTASSSPSQSDSPGTTPSASQLPFPIPSSMPESGAQPSGGSPSSGFDSGKPSGLFSRDGGPSSRKQKARRMAHIHRPHWNIFS